MNTSEAIFDSLFLIEIGTAQLLSSQFCHVTTTIGSAKAFWYSVSEHLSNM